VLDAVRAQLDRGTCFPEPVGAQVAAARALCERIDSADLVRFTSSGTEATLQALRAARAVTGRRVVAKVEGGYHGTQDDMMVSTHPSPDEAGPPDRPNRVPRAAGLTSSAEQDVVVIPFNDADGAAALIAEHGRDLAAVIVEPVLGSAGMIPAEPGYLDALRAATDECGAALVFDEVITFRLAHGGAEAAYDVRPDLTCLGKMIGGGFPLGVVGGSARFLAPFDPSDGLPEVAHPGSMNANPVSLVASLATLEHLTADVIATMNERGERLRDALGKVAADAGVALTVTGKGSLLGLHFTHGPVRTFRDTWTEDRVLAHEVFLGLINEGVLIDPRGAASVSSVTTDDDLDRFATALQTVLSRQ
jgi:glutamate-1-semialdehyde 2,1-aminomutase